MTIGVRGRVEGGGAAGVVYAPGTGSAIVTGELTGTPSEGPVAGYDGSMRAVFGMTSEDLKAMSTLRLSAGERLPDPLPDFALVYHEGHLTVTQADPLMGTGILVVDGNLTIAANSNSYFTGLVYVTGDYHQQAPSLVRGVVICQGRARVLGGGDLSELVYDPSVVDQLMTQMGRYRMSRATRRLDRRGVGGPR